MWETADLVTFTKEILMENFIFVQCQINKIDTFIVYYHLNYFYFI